MSALFALSKQSFMEANLLFPEMYDLMFSRLGEVGGKEGSVRLPSMDKEFERQQSARHMSGDDEQSKHIALLQQLSAAETERRCLENQINLLAQIAGRS